MHQGADLLASWREFTAANIIVNSNQALLILRRMRLLDSALADWASNLPSFFSFGILLNPEAGQHRWVKALLQHPGAPLVMHQYASLQTAYGWNLYRMLRILLNRSILSSRKMFPIYGDENSPDFAHPLFVIRELVNGIRSSVLSHFIVSISGKSVAASEQEICGMRGYFLLSPLMVASACLHAFPEYPDENLGAEWVDTVCSFIRSEIYGV